jgi:hypothetical protein
MGMTTKEIAEATGKTERSVRNWAKKAGEKISPVAEKISAAGHGKPADYTQEETLAIIEAGMGADAAKTLKYSLQGKITHFERTGKVHSMTTAQIAGAIGVSVDKIKRSAKELFPARIENGKTTHWTEAEVTAIKYNLRKNAQVMQAPKTRLEKELIIKQAMILQQEMIDELEKENAGLKMLLDYRTAGLGFYQGIAEAAGLANSDRDDMLDTYRRWR